MKKHTLTLKGGPPNEIRVPAAVLNEALNVLLEGTRLATRFAVEGESSRRGPRPTWLDSVAAIDITGLSQGSAVLAMEAPRLKDADAQRFGESAQRSLFGEQPKPLGELSGIDIYKSQFTAVINAKSDDISVDRALLENFLRFANLTEQHGNVIQLDGGQEQATPLAIQPKLIPELERLRDQAVPSQATRLVGVLDTISASNAAVVLTLKSGSKIPARVEEHDLNELRKLFGRDVVVSGMAHFKPSGQLRMLAVESIKEAGPHDRIFENAPTSHQRRPIIPPVAQTNESGVSAFFGTWPGDETDDELLEALRGIE